MPIAERAPGLRSNIEAWAKQPNDKPSRSEAIRRLIEFALAVKAKRQNADDK
jgi:metal-responsive CopG/Arc/MetJ family transcriptional regulator